MPEDKGMMGNNNDGSSNEPSSKQRHCRPTLISHGRLQAFTATDGAPVSGVRVIPSDQTTSDIRLKTNIEPLQDGALAQVMAVRALDRQIDYAGVVSVLTKSIQELQAEVTELRERGKTQGLAPLPLRRGSHLVPSGRDVVGHRRSSNRCDRA